MLRIEDGANAWIYFSAPRTYSKSAQPSGPGNDPFGRLKFSRDPALFHDARIERVETVQFGGQPVSCYVVQAAYQSMPGNHGAWNVTRTVWIAEGDGRVLRDTWDYITNPTSAAASGKGHITDDYTVIESGIPLADGRFVFTPPDGSREITLRAPVSTQSAPVSGRTPPLHAVPPEYSPEARAAGLQGTVSLYVEVNQDGHPGTVQVMQGLGLGLDEKAVEAVKQWEYAPSVSIREVDVPFRLERPAPWEVAGASYWMILPPDPHPPELVKPVVSHYTAPDSSACQSAGASLVTLLIGTDGKTSEVAAKDGASGALADAAVRAVESWQFQPATADGTPVEAHGEVELECQPGGMLLPGARPTQPIYRVGGGVSAPILVFKTEPQYSEEARKAKLQGTSMLSLQISPEGKVTAVVVTGPMGMGLDEKAMEAVKRWRFKPAMKLGEPVTVEANIQVNFKLL
jgi:TonB family protein